MKAREFFTFACAVSALLLIASCRRQTVTPSVGSREWWLKEHEGSIKNPQLVEETRWSLTYQDSETSNSLQLSKFMTGEAAISVKDLEAEWSEWSSRERTDFVGSVRQGSPTNAPQILRFVGKNSSLEELKEAQQ